jgi:monooxygenase
MSTEHVDVLIVGAGISGIGAAYHLQTQCPTKRYAILEGRESMGGTWDLFRYPGIRSDSDMFTLGFSFHPWKEAKAIADGPAILRYLKETAQTYGIDRHIRYQHKVLHASWSSEDAQWTVDVERGPQKESVRYRCNFFFVCSGYYRYDQGYMPVFPGQEQFKGQMIHPQQWPADLDYTGKRVVIIGSGATAVTLVPAMSDKAAHVTMLQRSPSYVLSLPAEDPIANGLRKLLPEKAAHSVSRWKNVMLSMALYQICKRYPAFSRKMLRKGTLAQLPQGLRRGYALQPALQPLGAAHVPGPEQRSVQGHPEESRVGRHRSDRRLRGRWHPPEVGPETGSRHRRQRDRPRTAGQRRRVAQRRRQGRQAVGLLQLQRA